MVAKIIKALESAGRLTTRELAASLGASRDAVYQRCKRLERDGRLASELGGAGEKNIFFFPMTKEVVTRENYERIDQLNGVIAETVRAFSIPQQKDRLVAALEVQFERLSERVAGSARSALEEFAEEVIDAAAVAEKQSDVMKHLGIRPMRPIVRIWSLGGQLSFS
jgi:DNA-binding Lrp family transcriptional regulator